ncbi:hypothetical protein N601_31350 [Rhodococcus erythropolis DN1]|nr:hypothetical protein N601_31350 [Rhodococcus erythropolis DN1]
MLTSCATTLTALDELEPASRVYDSLIRDHCDGLIQTHLRLAAVVVTV